MMYDFPANTPDEFKVKYLEEEVRRLRSQLVLMGMKLTEFNLRAKLPKGELLEKIYLKLERELKHNEAVIATLIYLKFTTDEICLMANLGDRVVDNLEIKIYEKLKVIDRQGIVEKVHSMVQDKSQ